jgi:flavin reductase (DIM6/NTAB) family NADH-FMN oxidoreductase RutF
MSVSAGRSAVGGAEHRRLMGHWPTGVALVTTEGSAGPSGCSANAITSVSLDPPLLFVCFAHASRTLQAVREAQRLCINVLSVAQRDLCRHFAQPISMSEKFASVPVGTIDGLPLIEGCVAAVLCDVVDDLTVGDHAVILCSPVAGTTAEGEPDPLLFFRGQLL